MNDIERLRSLKGAPLSCLHALHIAARPIGRAWLVDATGYKENSVTAAMRLLVELSYAARIARFEAWQLTDKGLQLPLFGTLKLEGDLITLACSSTSLIDKEFLMPSSLKLLPQQQIEGDLITLAPSETRSLPPAYALLVPYFLDKIGPANTALENALQHAADQDDDPAEIATRIEEWSDYLGSERGKGIKWPGPFVARQITDGVNTPTWFTTWLLRERGKCRWGYDWREWIGQHGFCVTCASEPCQCDAKETPLEAG